MRLLAVTPLWHKYPRSLDSILSQAAPCPVDYLMLAKDDPYTDGTLHGNYRNITHKYNRARDVFCRATTTPLCVSRMTLSFHPTRCNGCLGARVT